MEEQGHGKVLGGACATAGVMSHAGGPPALVRLQAHMVREVQVLFRYALSGL